MGLIKHQGMKWAAAAWSRGLYRPIRAFCGWWRLIHLLLGHSKSESESESESEEEEEEEEKEEEEEEEEKEEEEQSLKLAVK